MFPASRSSSWAAFDRSSSPDRAITRNPSAVLSKMRNGRAMPLRIRVTTKPQTGPLATNPRARNRHPCQRGLRMRDDTDQDRHQCPGRDSGRRAPSRRGERTERDGHPATDRDTSVERQPRDRHEHRDGGRDLGRALELKSGDRHAGRAHHRDHDCLQLDPPLGKAVADRDHERHSEDQQRQRHREPLAMQSGDRLAVGAAEHHHEQHRPAERPQRPSLPMQALTRSRPSLRDSLALRDSRSL